MLEKTFHTKYWDYSNNKFNIKGRVCLLNSLFWGFLGVVFIKIIHPFIVEKIDTIPTNELILYTIILSIIIIVDMIITIVKLNNINVKLEKLKEITNNIKDKLDELETKQISKEILQQTIEELKYKQLKIRRKLIKQTNRLKKAFPTMKSDAIEKINEYLKEKKENIKKIK